MVTETTLRELLVGLFESVKGLHKRTYRLEIELDALRRCLLEAGDARFRALLEKHQTSTSEENDYGNIAVLATFDVVLQKLKSGVDL